MIRSKASRSLKREDVDRMEDEEEAIPERCLDWHPLGDTAAGCWDDPPTLTEYEIALWETMCEQWRLRRLPKPRMEE